MRDEFLEGERFGAEVRAFIAERAPRIRLREGAHVPREAGQEREIRRWLGKLHAVGYLGAGWPPGRGGRSGHRPARDLILMEKLFRARAYRPLDQVMLASHAILAFGTDAQKDEYLPPTCSARASPGAAAGAVSPLGQPAPRTASGKIIRAGLVVESPGKDSDLAPRLLPGKTDKEGTLAS